MSANARPGTMSYAVVAPPLDWIDCDWNVVQRNAPGAISAIALTVSPVRLRVRFISGAGLLAISSPLVVGGHPDADTPTAGSPDGGGRLIPRPSRRP